AALSVCNIKKGHFSFSALYHRLFFNDATICIMMFQKKTKHLPAQAMIRDLKLSTSSSLSFSARFSQDSSLQHEDAPHSTRFTMMQPISMFRLIAPIFLMLIFVTKHIHIYVVNRNSWEHKHELFMIMFPTTCCQELY